MWENMWFLSIRHWVTLSHRIHSKFIHFPAKKKKNLHFSLELSSVKKKMRYRGRPTRSPQATERGRPTRFPQATERGRPTRSPQADTALWDSEGPNLSSGWRLGALRGARTPPPRSYSYYFLFIWDLIGSRVSYFCHPRLLFLQAKWNS